ncbi:MAG: phosphoenolpyruvate synthase, partial [Thiotrichales bacterium]|nr:phosphoenolpyruvate synthase [Thiotrichales bacterium]
MSRFTYIKFFDEIGIEDIPLVGGKNASLGEMYQALVPQGVLVPNGFAITSEAYRLLIEENQLLGEMHRLLDTLDINNVRDLADRGHHIRDLVYNAPLPKV